MSNCTSETSSTCTNLTEKIKSCKVLVVGAGGIGCELLKNLVLTGFSSIQIIDLDTIDVSNLNRQFLFRKQHVGKSKAVVARESALQFKPGADIKAHHDNVTNPRYDVTYFRQFALVMNALDNRAARSHVNRMCLAADVPLIESGTAGYLGQVTVIKKGLTECYECQPKTAEKTFPGCTIRNTPSEPIHCIVWAKHLFNQLFGEDDPDEDVSPDMADPELAGETIAQRVLEKMDEKGRVQRVSTRIWAMTCSYDPEKIFNKLFHDDIKYLLSMDKLWLERRPPQPLKWNNLPDAVAGSSVVTQAGIRDQHVWSILECGNYFKRSLENLKNITESRIAGDPLIWDKDDEDCMDFVTACANIRSYCFGIPQKSRFDVKSMAGNIIPAIATTNAVISGLVVLQGLKILEGLIEECKAVFLCKEAQSVGKLLASCVLEKPKPHCYVCSSKPEVDVFLNTEAVTVQTLEEKILKAQLHMVAPDVEIDDGKGTILISSEEGETEENKDKMLNIFGVRNGTRLKCDDFRQNYVLVVIINQCNDLPDQQEFLIKGEAGKPSEELTENHDNQQLNGIPTEEVAEEEDVLIIEEPPRKRKQESELPTNAEKRARHDSDIEEL